MHASIEKEIHYNENSLKKSVYPERSGQLLSYYFRIKYKTDMSNIKYTATGLLIFVMNIIYPQIQKCE